VLTAVPTGGRYLMFTLTPASWPSRSALVCLRCWSIQRRRRPGLV